jgi:hypothetical protein
MGFAPSDFEVPELLEHERFRVRPLTVHDVVKDYDAEVWLWVRAGELDSGLDAVLYATVRGWIEECWPFRRVAYPGRDG